MIHADQFFSSDPLIRGLAYELYKPIAKLPLICPHGHVNPQLFSDPNATFGSPVDLFIIPDHYVTRMLYSQGISLESLGIPRIDGSAVETDHRRIWNLFCENFDLFRGTPSGIWLRNELIDVFGIEEKPTLAIAERLYDEICEMIDSPEFAPRALFERFNINVLCTTDSVLDTLNHHQTIHSSSWNGRILPTFRPDAVLNLDAPNWHTNIGTLSSVSGVDVVDFSSFIRALEQRREYFKLMGAVATDHACITPYTFELSSVAAASIFQRALKGHTTSKDTAMFSAHMLMEMARMSIEDGLVMQIHPGSYRNHNQIIYNNFGLDKGCDIPLQTGFTLNLLPLLNKYGNDNRLSLILFTLDEATYSRELAPLAGHYPALKLGPPWWFHDSLNGMARYFDLIMETAGLYNTVGFNDDTRAFCSIPARHDVWRRASANWVAGLVARHIIDVEDAVEMMRDLTAGLAQKTYKLI